jgi:hypothetical protein
MHALAWPDFRRAIGLLLMAKGNDHLLSCWRPARSGQVLSIFEWGETRILALEDTLWCTDLMTLAEGGTPNISLVCENGHTLERRQSSINSRLF